jgi:hypothetical protein
MTHSLDRVITTLQPSFADMESHGSGSSRIWSWKQCSKEHLGVDLRVCDSEDKRDVNRFGVEWLILSDLVCVHGHTSDDSDALHTGWAFGSIVALLAVSCPIPRPGVYLRTMESTVRHENFDIWIWACYGSLLLGSTHPSTFVSQYLKTVTYYSCRQTSLYGHLRKNLAKVGPISCAQVTLLLSFNI